MEAGLRSRKEVREEELLEIRERRDGGRGISVADTTAEEKRR